MSFTPSKSPSASPEHLQIPRHAAPRAIPTEVLDKIVRQLLSEQREFASVASVSRVSWQFRQISLKGYYETLNVRSARHWVRLCQIKGVYSWSRALHCSTSFFQYRMDALARFTSLQSLELDFTTDGLATQKSRCSLLFKNVTADLTTLKLTYLPRIDTALLTLLAARFPSLVILELSCTERLDEECCWLCFEESSSCTIHSPIPEHFSSIQKLTSAFANALKPLGKLEHLYLGIFLSDADVLTCHLDRCAAVVISSPRTGYYSSPPFGPNKCAICLVEHGTAVGERERIGSTLMGALLPSLKSIGWSTYFAKDRPGDDVERKATIFQIQDSSG
ncbi:hypothetical protein C8Q74DRAFT_556500 [Fomes fomentarius]|nr:hypothetical protein C8Q74DRAFT_556500 [Fomes fomentarius]